MIPMATSLVCLGAPRQRKPRAPLSSMRVGRPTAGGGDAGGDLWEPSVVGLLPHFKEGEEADDPRDIPSGGLS